VDGWERGSWCGSGVWGVWGVLAFSEVEVERAGKSMAPKTFAFWVVMVGKGKIILGLARGLAVMDGPPR